MNKVILQIWEESERGFGVRPDGCSLHINSEERNIYIKSIYDNRDSEVPTEYDRIVGDEFLAFIGDDLFEIVNRDKSIRITEYQMNNLISMEDLIINE